MHFSDRTVEALVAGVVGVVAVVGVRWALGHAFARYERRLAGRDPDGAARRRTTLGFLQRVIVAIVAAIAIWNVLSLYDATAQIGKALLASSAVIALFAGLAFSTPPRISGRECSLRSRSRYGSATGSPWPTRPGRRGDQPDLDPRHR
jgi:hypothetical protein